MLHGLSNYKKQDLLKDEKNPEQVQKRIEKQIKSDMNQQTQRFQDQLELEKKDPMTALRNWYK